ncbi:hypothetical protein CPJCM30710_18510 [Clostridium polyendosporum]|uniref:DUF262 domain-containing protein n=1 Tax=Clostridium polyendosporum TaxID=69208 RepID=A0A919S105_9CLOT|nr:DUF262 domain-containing protein [Clostridium polyendosporum]GIM29185.1 hypothetical protein CPJCM30710_18510 [Clostridium polyendosporum]
MFTEMIKAKEYYIKDLLSDKFLFEIPDYQRAYSWTKENLQQLIDDIISSIEVNKEEYGDNFESYEPYFIGSIVLCSKEYKDDGWGLYDVIDGQQRLTSIIMLIATIRDLINNNQYKNVLSSLIYQQPNELMGVKESIRVKVRGKELDFFKKYVLELGGTEEACTLDEGELSEAKTNMFTAINVFRNSFLDENGEVLHERVNEFIKYILQKVVLVVITTDSFTSAFRLFNVINARGLPLTNADLLKSENLRVIDEEIRNKYTDMWETDEQDVGKERLEKIISFIRAMKLKKKASTTIFEEFNKKIFVQEPEYRGVNFVEHLNKVKTIFEKYIEEGVLSTGDKEKDIYYKKLVLVMKDFLPFDEWMAAVISFVEKFNNDNLTFEFLKVLEKRITIDWINGNSFADRLSRVYSILEAIDASSIGEDVLKSDVFVGDLERTRVYFENSLNDIEFYSKGRMMIPKYILVRLDIELRSKDDMQYSDKIMLEHILPRNAKDAYWVTNFSTEQRRNWANRLGNLVIINGTKNTKANNKAFAQKVEQYISKKGDFAITKEILNFKDWDIEILKSRHSELVKRSVELWTNI